MPLLLRVMLAGGIGTLLRYGIFLLGKTKDLPFGHWGPAAASDSSALAVNLLGGLVAGAATSLPPERLSPDARVVIILGFCGGLTTFASFAYDTVLTLVADPAQGIEFAFSSVMLGALAFALGFVLGSRLG
jgi:fluoride exporter